MRISELSASSGLPVQTIKYYLREGLLPRGTATGATRAEYGEAHLERLRLIRALREVAGLPVASVKRLTRALDDDRLSLHELLGTAHYALGPRVDARPEDPDWRAAREDVDALVAELGWNVRQDAPARDLLAKTFVTLRELGQSIELSRLRPYVEAAQAVAAAEASRLPADTPRDEAVRTATVTTVLYEQVLIALHRLAQENASSRHFT